MTSSTAPMGESQMADFWVSWMKPHGRARIHDGACPNCNHGAGQRAQEKTGSGATGWEGPYATLDQARERLAAFEAKGYAHTGFCRTCLRSYR